MAQSTPIHPHKKQESPWLDICRDKLRKFANRVNHVQFDVHATTLVKATRGSYKCYVWLTREKYAPIKLKVRIRYDHDIFLMEKTLNGIYDSLKPPNYINQDDISTEVCSSLSSETESSDVFGNLDV